MTTAMKNQYLEAEFGDFFAVLGRWKELKPAEIALRDDKSEVSWQELAEKVDRIASDLIDTGLKDSQ